MITDSHLDASHHKMPILALDVDAEGTRLATGGLGPFLLFIVLSCVQGLIESIDQKAKIWSIPAITSQFTGVDAPSANAHHICTLSHQTGMLVLMRC